MLPVLFAACVAPDVRRDFEEDLPESGFQFYSGSSSVAGDFYVGVTEYGDEQGRSVVLIPMIHVADAGFYDAVSEELDRADVVLAEGVRGTPSLGPQLFLMSYVFGNMRRLASFAQLTAQSEALSFGANVKNADLSIEEWQAGSPWWTPLVQVGFTPFLVVVMESAALTTWISQGLYGVAFAGEQIDGSWRHFLVEDSSDDEDDGLELLLPGIIHRRNAAVLDTLDHLEPSMERVAIPWGANHMPGIADGLVERGFAPISHRWIRAVSVRTFLQEWPEGSANEASDFYVPYLLHWRHHEHSWYASLLLRSILLESPPDSFRLELLWELLASVSVDGETKSGRFQLLPTLFGRPLLFERAYARGDARWRFLLFFELGSLERD